jgi:glycosyltransferase involved in cell wall biosynthesis
MTQILHIHSPDPDFQTKRTLELLLTDTNQNFAPKEFIIGKGGDTQNVATAALLLRRTNNNHQIIHAWGATALKATVLAGCNGAIYSPHPETAPKINLWLTRFLTAKGTIVSPTNVMHDYFVKQGISPARCQVIHPGVDPKKIPQKQNSDLRNQLGFAESDFIILAPGESTRNAAHRTAVWAASILHVLDERFRLLAMGRGQQSPSLLRFAKRLHQDKLVTLAEAKLNRPVDLEELATVADAALIPAAPWSSTLPTLICQASGLPIVANQTPELAEILANDPAAQLMTQPTPKTLAQAIWQLTEDPKSPSEFNATIDCQYTTSNAISQWQSLYQKTLTASQRPINLIDTPQTQPVS